jgi:hypothetical protein
MVLVKISAKLGIFEPWLAFIYIFPSAGKPAIIVISTSLPH